MDPDGAAEVFAGGNDALADVLLYQWAQEDDARTSNCRDECLVVLALDDLGKAVSVDPDSSLKLVTGEPSPCGCYGGSLWRMRYGKQPRRYAAGLVSYLAAYLERPPLPPLNGNWEADPDVEVFRLQYMGERFRLSDGGSCYHTAQRNKYFGVGGDGGVRLVALTPSLNSHQTLGLMTYRSDRLRGCVRIFSTYYKSLLCLHGGAAEMRRRAESSEHYSVVHLKVLVDTTKAMTHFYGAGALHV